MNSWYLTQSADDQRDVGSVATARVPTGPTQTGSTFSEKDDRNFMFRTVGDAAGALASGFRAVVPEPVRDVGGSALRTAWNVADTPLSQRVGFRLPEMRGPVDEIGNFLVEEATRPSNYALAAASFLTGGAATPALFGGQMAARTGAKAAVTAAARPLTRRLGQGALTRAALTGSAPKRAIARMAGGIIEPASGLGTRGLGSRVGAEVATAASARASADWADRKLEDMGASKGWRVGLGLAAGLAGGMGGAMGSRRALQSLGRIDASEVAEVRSLLKAAKGATPLERQGIYRRAQRDAMDRGIDITAKPEELVDPEVGYWEYHKIQPYGLRKSDDLAPSGMSYSQRQAEAAVSQAAEREQFRDTQTFRNIRQDEFAQRVARKDWNDLNDLEKEELRTLAAQEAYLSDPLTTTTINPRTNERTVTTVAWDDLPASGRNGRDARVRAFNWNESNAAVFPNTDASARSLALEKVGPRSLRDADWMRRLEKTERDINNERAQWTRFGAKDSWISRQVDPIRRKLQDARILNMSDTGKQIHLGYDAAQTAADTVRSGLKGKFRGLARRSGLNTLVGDTGYISKNGQAAQLWTTTVNGKQMIDVERNISDPDVPITREMWDQIEEMQEEQIVKINSEQANGVEVEKLTGEDILDVEDLGDVVRREGDSKLVSGVTLSDFIEHAYNPNSRNFSKTGADREVYVHRERATPRRNRPEMNTSGMVLPRESQADPRVRKANGKIMTMRQQMDEGNTYNHDLVDTSMNRLKMGDDAINRRWVERQLEKYGENPEQIMMNENPGLIKQLSMQRNRLGNILARTRANKAISSLYGKEKERHNRRVLANLKKDMARVRAKLNDPNTALSYPEARRQTLEELKGQLKELRGSYDEVNAALTGADWNNIITVIKRLGVKKHIEQIDRLDMQKNATRLRDLQARQDGLLLKIDELENDPELINPELFGLGADGRTVRPSPSARNRKAASYQNKLDKLEAKIEEADRNMIELSQESEKVLATMDWIESDIGVDEFMVRAFRDRLEVLRGTERENAGIVWANIRKQLDESSSRSYLESAERTLKVGQKYQDTLEARVIRADEQLSGAQAQIETARQAYNNTKNRYDNALQRAINGAELEDGVIPGTARRQISGARGNQYFNEDLAAQIERDFGDPNWLGKTGGALVGMNNVSRQLLATLDFSNAGIQGLLAIASHPLAASRAMWIATKGTIANPETWDDFFLNNYRRTIDVNGVETPIGIDEFTRLGGKWMDADATGEMLLHQPGILKLLDRTNRKVGSREFGLGKAVDISNTHFSRQGNIFRYLMFVEGMKNQSFLGKAGFSNGKWLTDPTVQLAGGRRSELNEADRRELVETINNMTGWRSGSPTSVEKGLLFAPRFFRSQLDTLGKVATGTGPSADYARDAMIRLIMLGSGFVFMANQLAGEDTDTQVLKFRADGTPYLNSNFMKIRAFGTDISVFGPWQSMFQLLTLGMIEGPDSALVRTLENKSSFAVGLLNDIRKGATYGGTSLRPKTAGDVFNAAKSLAEENLLPISVQESLDVVKGEAPVASGAFGFFGVNAAPLTAYELRENAALKWIDTLTPEEKELFRIAEDVSGYGDMSKSARGMFDELYPEYSSEYFDDKRKYAARGDKDAQQSLLAHDIDVNRLEKQKELVRVAELGAAGEIDPATGAPYPAISPSELSKLVAKIDYEAMISKRQVYGEDGFSGGTPIADAKNQWYAIYERNNIGGVKMDWDGVSRDQDRLLKSLAPELRVELEEFVQGNQKHYIAPLRPIVQAKALLRESGYYDVGDQLFQNTFAPIVEQILGQRPTSVSGFQDLYETLKYSSPQTAALLEPINRDINSYIRSQREVFRLTHPEIQGALETLGWVNPMPTMA
jgi:hypothetical protein